ncbi:NAP domain-containing protein [Rhizoctonia solani AG-1 IA]|uniref:NAP domain-containing protein n=1 Tax=Thanatephorus cucumeris (strain AG1-IA) TaxID=983506 RepID=L8WEI1_THACA|nr:NAP domain-containing protein [Rhizoctonia solani AG-1 IA]
MIPSPSMLIADETPNRLEYITEPALGYKLTFVFEENSFFENKELTKSYYYQKELGYGGEYMYARAEGTKIKWKEEKDLTKTVEIKKQRNKNTNRTRLVRRTQAVPSFFDFFSPPVPPSSDPELIEAGFAVDGDELEEKELEELEEKLELDYQLGEDFKEKIYLPGWRISSNIFSQEDEDEDDSDSDAGQPRRAPAAPKKKGEAEKAEECKNHGLISAYVNQYLLEDVHINGKEFLKNICVGFYLSVLGWIIVVVLECISSKMFIFHVSSCGFLHLIEVRNLLWARETMGGIIFSLEMGQVNAQRLVDSFFVAFESTHNLLRSNPDPTPLSTSTERFPKDDRRT